MFTIGKENLLSALDGFVKVQVCASCFGVVGIYARIPNFHRGRTCYNLHLRPHLWKNPPNKSVAVADVLPHRLGDVLQ